MKFVLPKSILSDMVSNVSIALSKSPSLPAHGLITFHTYENGVLISAHSPDISVQSFQEVAVGSALAFGVDGLLLADIVKRLSDGDVVLSIDNFDLGLKITNKGNSVVLKVVDEDNCMAPHKYDHMKFTKTTGLIECIKAVSYAVSDDETRPQLNGVLINEVEVVAIDGHRMSIKTHGLDLSTIVDSTRFDTILPAESLDKITKIFKGNEVELFADDSSVHFNNGKVAASVRKVARDYPKYKTIIPISGHDILAVNRKALVDAIDFVRVATDKQRSINLDLSDGFVRVWAHNDRVSNIEQIIEAQFNNTVELGFNSDYLLDVAKRLKNDIIYLEIRGPLSPMVIKEENSLHVVMPKKR